MTKASNGAPPALAEVVLQQASSGDLPPVRCHVITTEAEPFEDVARQHVAAIVDDDDLDAFLIHFLLTSVSNRISTDVERTVYRPAHHTRATFRVLFTLWSVGTLSQKDLAHLAGVTPPSMSTVLKAFDGRGIIESRRSQDDERLVDVTISDVGRKEIEQLYRAHHERERSWLQAHPPPTFSSVAQPRPPGMTPTHARRDSVRDRTS